MRLLFVVSAFPELTFILRTTIALAARGHHVAVMARRRGNWTNFQDELPLPPNLTVKYQLPDTGLSGPRRLARLIIRLPFKVAQHPRAALQTLKLCLGHPETRRAGVRAFIKYMSFADLHPDVIQFDFPMTASGYSLLSELLKAPTVVSCRGADIHMVEQRDPDQREARLESVRCADAVHTVSDEMADEVRRLTGRTDGIWTNRPAVAVDRIRPKDNYAAHTPPMIVAVGRLTWKKGYDYLLAALMRVRQAGILFQAQIIGAGELHAVLRFSVEDLGLRDMVKLVGSLPSGQVLDRLRQADIFVLSSHEEGISNAALEAMACGLPVVTTNAGGMAEAARDAVDGFVVQVRDIAALTDRIQRLLLDPALRERMGRSARARAEAEFSLERQARMFEEMYQSVMLKLR